MIDLQKDYHTLKELRAQLQEAVDQLQEEGDSLTVDLELGIGDTQEKASRLLELSLLLLQSFGVSSFLGLLVVPQHDVTLIVILH
jgi:bacterioferritin (cytochrome b1)